MSAHSISPAHEPRQRWFLIGLGVVFLAIFLQFYFKVQKDDRSSRSAFKRWQSQVLEMGRGEDIWRKHNYPNPPIMALILYPLAQLPAAWGSLAWFLLKLAMTFLVIHWICACLDRPERPFPMWAKVLALALAMRPIAGDLVHGNVNLFILFLTAGSLVAFCRGRDLLSGLLLALGICCKVTPALFVPYFVWKRSWRVLAGCAAGLPLFLWLVPGLCLGWEQNRQGLASWYDVMVAPYAVEGKVWSEHNNQSLPAFAMRMLTYSPSFSTYLDDVHYTPTGYDNLLSLNPALVQWGLKACLILFGLLVMWTCRTQTTDRSDWRLWAEFSVIAVGMLLFSERTWKHHCVLLLLPFMVLCQALAADWGKRRRRVMLVAALGFAALCMVLTSTGVTPGHDEFGEMAQVYGAYVWAFLGLLLALTLTLRAGIEARQPIEARRSSGNDAPMASLFTRGRLPG